jgi:Myb/SANT-like DNA-binding domain
MGPKSIMRWDQTSERAYLDSLINAVKKGQRTDTGWKPEVIGNAIITFQGKGLKAFTKQQFETKRDGWKKKWKLFNTILNITGFGYNEHTGRIEAEDDCWDRVLLQYRDAKQFRWATLQYRAELDEIFGGTAADGRYAQNDDYSLIDPSLLGEPDDGLDTPGISRSVSQGVSQLEEDELDLNPIEEDDADLVEPTTQEEVSTPSIASQLDLQTDHFQSQTTMKVVPLKRAHSASFQGNKSKRTVQDTFNRIATVYKSKMTDKPVNNQSTPRVLAIRTLNAEYKQLDDT